MEKYTVSSVGPYIVLLDSLEWTILFSLKKYDFITAGEVTIEGKRHVVMRSIYNTFQTIPLDSLDVNEDFTSKVPKKIKIINGMDGASVKTDDNNYVELSTHHDYFMYESKIYVTDDYHRLYEAEYKLVNYSTHCGSFVDNFECLTCGKPYFDNFEFNNFQEIGLQIFIINKVMYYTTGEYMPELSFTEGSLIGDCERHDSNTRYYLSLYDKNIFLTEMDEDKKIMLSNDMSKAARPPNFGAIYKFPDTYNIKAGKRDYGNIIIRTSESPGMVELYSTVAEKEIIFYITPDNDINTVAGHEYPTPKATKAAIS